MRTLNLGILAHVDAGKTSLTERLLHAAGVIDKIGSVDDGNTQTDTLALERQRGITIKAAVVSFVAYDTTINLIDTPGHPDFIAEVERALSVLDGAVLVVSAVEGVQAQTRVLMRALKRLGIPTLVFVNKLDRRGADIERTLEAISAKLTPDIVPMGFARDLGSREAVFVPYGGADPEFRQAVLEQLAERDEAMLAAFVEGRAVRDARLRGALNRQSRTGRVHPVFMGSAITGEGVEALLEGITRLLPAPEPRLDAPVSGTVFKVERGPAGENVAYMRLFTGTLRARDRLALGGKSPRVTAVGVFERGAVVRRDAVTAGGIAKLWGLGSVRIGDSVGAVPRGGGLHHFAPPTLETQIYPLRAADRTELWAALLQLAEQDPLINLREDEELGETYVSLYGEVQKEVIQHTLLADFGIEVGFRETTMICVERPAAAGNAIEVIFKPPNPFLATVGLRIEPAPAGSGVSFRLETMFGAMPVVFYQAIEEAVTDTLRQGLNGWQVTDCAVALTDVAQSSPSSTAADFRNLTPLVLMSALAAAGTDVCEPIHRFELEVPADCLAAALSLLARLRATPEAQVSNGATATLAGEIAAARVHDLQLQLPGLTRGEGVLETAFERYRPVTGPPPSRPRSGANPLNRKQYMLRVQRRVEVASDGPARPG